FESWASTGWLERPTRSATAQARDTLVTMLVHASQEGWKTEVSRLSAKPSIRHRGMSRLSWLALLLGLGGGLALTSASAEGQVASGFRFEVVATSIPRPAQLALTASGRLVVLSHGWRGDAAAEIFWLDPRGALPVNASVAPRVVIPFAEGPRKTALGSLAVDPRSGDLFLGEENGNRIYRLTGDKRLTPIVVGLNHLLGGSSLAADPEGRVVVLDYASFESQLRSEAPLPPSLAWLAGAVFVSRGFHIRELYRVSPAGVVTSIARDLGDPQGIAVDGSGALYVAETALHRIIRIVPADR